MSRTYSTAHMMIHVDDPNRAKHEVMRREEEDADKRTVAEIRDWMPKQLVVMQDRFAPYLKLEAMR